MGRKVLKLHDLQREYCSYHCSNQDIWHERLVRSFPQLSKAAQSSESVNDKIIDTAISMDQQLECSDYLVDNAVRHMSMAYYKLSSLLRCLLSNSRWIRNKSHSSNNAH